MRVRMGGGKLMELSTSAALLPEKPTMFYIFLLKSESELACKPDSMDILVICLSASVDF